MHLAVTLDVSTPLQVRNSRHVQLQVALPLASQTPGHTTQTHIFYCTVGEMGSSFSFNGPTGAGGSGGGAADGAGSAESRSSRGAYERLVRLLGSGAYRHKMDAFDLRPLHAMVSWRHCRTAGGTA